MPDAWLTSCTLSHFTRHIQVCFVPIPVYLHLWVYPSLWLLYFYLPHHIRLHQVEDSSSSLRNEPWTVTDEGCYGLLKSHSENSKKKFRSIDLLCLKLFWDRLLQCLGGLYLKPPKFEHIFVAVITFFPFLLCRYFDTSLLLIVCALRWYVKSLYRHLFLEDTCKKARVTQKRHFIICGKNSSKVPWATRPQIGVWIAKARSCDMWLFSF